MAEFRIEDAAFAGFGLLARKPLAVLTWALVYLVFLAVVIVPFAGGLVAFITTVAKSGSNPDPSAMLAGMSGLFGMILLLFLGSLVVGTVVSCAVIRAVLQPENSAFAYLRLGGEELWVMLVQFVRSILIAVIQTAMAIPVAILTGVATLGGQNAGLVGIRLLGQLAMYAVVVWVTLRLSLAGPITFTERQFRLFESWTLTRGNTWRLLGVGVIISVVGFVVYLIVAIVGVAGVVGIWTSTPHPTNIQTLLSEPPEQWSQTLAPILILIGGAVFFVGALLTPITLAPWPFIYKQLQPAADVAATFS